MEGLVEFRNNSGCSYKYNYGEIFRRIASGELDEKGAYRALVLGDLWFVLFFVMKVGSANHPFVVKMCRMVEDGPKTRTLDLWAREHYKDQCCETPVLTTSGWKKHGDLDIGDNVYSLDGVSTEVIGKTPIWEKNRCYRVIFTDGSFVVAGQGHLWLVMEHSRRRQNYKRINRYPAIRSTGFLAEMNHDGLALGGHRVAIPFAAPIEGIESLLPVHPYVLGAWLGDGSSRDGRITCGDSELFKHIEECGYTVAVNKDITKTIYGLSTGLRKLGILKNKHIPEVYQRASIRQRRNLLQGLMDTDGSCDARGTATFCNTSEELTEGIYRLACSLGLHPSKRKYMGEYEGSPYPFYQVSFQAYISDEPFKLKRKLARCKEGDRWGYRYIAAVEPVVTTPTNCIQVAHPSGMYLTGKDLIPTHNSSIVTLAEVIQKVLSNSDERVGIFSHTRPIAKGFLRSIKLLFEGSDLLKECFPDVLYGNPEQEAPKWSEDDGLILKRKGYCKESTIEAWGLIEGMPTGKHFTHRVYDDIETADVVDNPDMIMKVKGRFDLSRNLGTLDGTERVVGTTYSHQGILEGLRTKDDIHGRKIYLTRVVTATDDGTANGEPVLLSRERLDELKVNEHVFNCQQLLNPSPVGVRKLDSSLIKEIEAVFIPSSVFKFMVIDPAGDDKTGKGDAWAIEVWGVEPKADDLGASNIYLLDAAISPFRETEAIEEIVRMYMRNGMIMQVGVEKVALSTTETHVINALAARGRHISVENKTLFILRPSGRNKTHRIEAALAWPLFNSKIFISSAVSNAYKERFKLEMDKFPYWHDDGLDAAAYLYDMIKDYRFVFWQNQTVPQYEPVNSLVGY